MRASGCSAPATSSSAPATTKIRPAYGAIGFSPDGGTSWALTRSLGATRALDLMLTNGSLTAAEAHLSGLVARLVEDEDLRATAVAVASELATGPMRAMVRTRALVRGAAPARSSSTWTTRRG